MVLLRCHANRRLLGKNNRIFKSGLYHTKAEKWVFLGVAETIAGSLLFCSGSNVQCLFNLLYYIIWLLHQSTTPRNYQKIGLTLKVAWWSLFVSACKAIPKLRFRIRPLETNFELTSELFAKMSCNKNENNGTFCSIIFPCCQLIKLNSWPRQKIFNIECNIPLIYHLSIYYCRYHPHQYL